MTPAQIKTAQNGGMTMAMITPPAMPTDIKIAVFESNITNSSKPNL